MLVLTEVTSTWRRLVHLREASRAENISFECRGMNEPHSPCANDIEGSERHLPDTTRPESISSDYGGADEHRRDIGSQSTLCVPLKEPPRSRSAQRGRSLDPEGNLYRHSYVTPNESSSFREVSNALAVVCCAISDLLTVVAWEAHPNTAPRCRPFIIPTTSSSTE